MHRGTLEQTNGATCIASLTAPALGVAPFPHVLDRCRYAPCYSRINITVIALWVATPFLSTMSVAAVCVAVSTNQWLLTQENIKNENYTGRGDDEYFPKNTVSGLWTLCYTNPGKQELFCSNIEYFPKEEYSPDLKDSTMAIPYTVTKSAAFFILSTFMVFVGELCCLCGHYSRQRRLLTFISGLIFIISGLLMLIGLVMYISIFKAEVGGKLRPTSQLQPAVFTYKYGYSFILYVTGFVSTEISGTCAVFLYIYWHQKDWRNKGYDFRAKLISEAVLPDDPPLPDSHPFCRRHPNNLSSDGLPCDGLPPQRRLYLDRHSDTCSEDGYPSPLCLEHSMSCSLFNEFESNFVPKKQTRKVGTDDPMNGNCPELCPHHTMSSYNCQFLAHNCFPKDASTNTAPECGDLGPDDDCSSTTTHDHDFVPFDLDEATPVPHVSDRSIRLDEVMFEVLSKTTPV